MKLIATLAVVCLLAGCTTPNLVGNRGNKTNTGYSLQDRRAAKLHVSVAKEIPPSAQPMGDFTVERCHQYAQDESPGEAVLADDLLLLAYAEGADGLTNLRFSKESGLLKNCWFVAKGTAAFYKTQK